MEEKNIVGVYTTPAKAKVVHMMLQEDGTEKKWEEEYRKTVKRGNLPPEEYMKERIRLHRKRGEQPPQEFLEYFKRKQKQTKKPRRKDS